MSLESPSIGVEGSFEVVEHTADWAIKVRAADLKYLFVTAARGMNSLMKGERELAAADKMKELTLSAEDAESLLVEWLSELAYWAETESLIFQNFDIRNFGPKRLDAIITGGQISSLDKHIKAVTYHNLKIESTSAGLETTIVFDV